MDLLNRTRSPQLAHVKGVPELEKAGESVVPTSEVANSRFSATAPGASAFDYAAGVADHLLAHGLAASPGCRSGSLPSGSVGPLAV